MKKLLICLPLALLFIACEDKPKTQAVPSENKDIVAAVAVAEESLQKNDVECGPDVDFQKNIVDILIPFSYRVYSEEFLKSIGRQPPFDDDELDPTKRINKNWVSLYKDSVGNYYIKQADFSLKDGGEDPCTGADTKSLSSKEIAQTIQMISKCFMRLKNISFMLAQKKNLRNCYWT